MGQSTKTIQCSDSLVWDENVLGKKDSQYDVVLTNPPFGVNIQAGTPETLSKFDLAYKYKKMKRNVAIVWGGYTSEAVISAKSMAGIYSFLPDQEDGRVLHTKITAHNYLSAGLCLTDVPLL